MCAIRLCLIRIYTICHSILDLQLSPFWQQWLCPNAEMKGYISDIQGSRVKEGISLNFFFFFFFVLLADCLTQVSLHKEHWLNGICGILYIKGLQHIIYNTCLGKVTTEVGSHKISFSVKITKTVTNV